MDTLAELGAGWFCTAANVAGSSGFQMATCGGSSSRYAVGLTTSIAVILLCLFAAWRGTERWR